jgi:hypothetical protein
MPKKLVIQGNSTGETIDHYHQLDLTLQPNGDVSIVDFLVTTGTVTVNIGTSPEPGFYMIEQLAETDNVLTKVTITGFGIQLVDPFLFGDAIVTDIAATATSPTTIHSSLSLIDASATTGQNFIDAGAANTGGTHFVNGSILNSNVTITYDGLTILGGSGQDVIENDANNGIVIDGNHDSDSVILGGAGASTTVGSGANDFVVVGATELGTKETPGQALGDTVTFGNGATATLFIGDAVARGFTVQGQGAEAGPTAGTNNIGQTNVIGAADGMMIDFHVVTASNTIVDETSAAGVAAATTLAAKENAAVAALGGPGVAYFKYQGDEYFIATNGTTETAVGPNDAVVHLVGVNLAATISDGIVTLHTPV